eukprot:scaffold3_cov108-Isochrysis_galbana.AAC.9
MTPAAFPQRVAIHGLSNGSQHLSRFVPIFISSSCECVESKVEHELKKPKRDEPAACTVAMEQMPADARAAPSASEPNDTVMDIHSSPKRPRDSAQGNMVSQIATVNASLWPESQSVTTVLLSRAPVPACQSLACTSPTRTAQRRANLPKPNPCGVTVGARPGAGDRGPTLGPPLPLVKGNPHRPTPCLGPPPYPHPGPM